MRTSSTLQSLALLIMALSLAMPTAALASQRYTLGAATIEQATTDALRRSGAPDGLAISLDSGVLHFQVPDATTPLELAIEDATYDAARGRIVAIATLSNDGQVVARRTLGGRATLMTEVPVLNRRVNAGEVIGESDLDHVTIPRDRINADMVTDADRLIGLSARHTVSPNQPLRQRDFQTPIVIAKGALVTIRLQNRALSITAQGRAAEDGALGQTIRVINTTSNRTIDAKVVSRDLVETNLGSGTGFATASAAVN